MFQFVHLTLCETHTHTHTHTHTLKLLLLQSSSDVALHHGSARKDTTCHSNVSWRSVSLCVFKLTEAHLSWMLSCSRDHRLLSVIQILSQLLGHFMMLLYYSTFVLGLNERIWSRGMFESVTSTRSVGVAAQFMFFTVCFHISHWPSSSQSSCCCRGRKWWFKEESDGRDTGIRWGISLFTAALLTAQISWQFFFPPNSPDCDMFFYTPNVRVFNVCVSICLDSFSQHFGKINFQWGNIRHPP